MQNRPFLDPQTAVHFSPSPNAPRAIPLVHSGGRCHVRSIDLVLSQRVPRDQKLHPCAFLWRRLSPVECNYTIGDRELLVVKLALEEWQHYLEGAELPFVV